MAGEDADIGRFPYTVSLQGVSDLGHFCGGSLIAPDVVLGAAHCAKAKAPKDIAVRTNPHKLRQPIAGSEILAVTDVILHPQHQTLPTYLDHDVMVLKLATPSNQRPLVRINPSPNIPSENEQLLVMGWGTTKWSENAPPEVLQVAESFPISNEECLEISQRGPPNLDYEGLLSDDMMCTRQEGQGFCQGDSGKRSRNLLILQRLDSN